MEGETLYGSEDSQSVMSERVQTLARNIYQEFQRMIQKYDEDVVKVCISFRWDLCFTWSSLCAC